MTFDEAIVKAKSELITAVNSIQKKYGIPPIVYELMIGSVLSDVRGINEIETAKKIADENQEKIDVLEAELKKAKKEAKKVLKEEDPTKEDKQEDDTPEADPQEDDPEEDKGT